MAKEEKPKAPRNSTGNLPGVEGPGVGQISIPELDAAAEKYVSIRDKRCLISPKEIAAKAELIDLMHANADKLGVSPEGSIVYRFGEEVVILTPGKENVKVKSAAAVDAGE